MRLTKKVVEQLLALNDGFEASTHFKSKNFTESRTYKIIGGVLQFRSTGKTSWADSRFDTLYVADPEQTRRFLKKFLDQLRTDGLV
jgi:hypothetical protein